MEPIIAFTIVMFVWTIGELVSQKTKALVSMMLVASLIFLVAFATDFFPHDLIQDSGLFGLGSAAIGIIIVHLGTMMSIDDLKAQWRTFLIGSLTVIVLSGMILLLSSFVFDLNIAVAGTASITGGTLSILMVQDKVVDIVTAGGNTGILSSYLLAVFPLLILNLKNLVGFLVTSSILKREAKRVQAEYRKGNIEHVEVDEEGNDDENPVGSRLPAFLQTAYGTLFLLGLTVYVARFLSDLTNGTINTFVIALLMGIVLRHFKLLKPSALSATDSFGLLMISIMVLAFGPLADIVPSDLIALIWPIVFFLVIGVVLIFLVSYVLGRLVGYSGAMSIAIGMTTFFGFPGTMVLTKEAATAVGESEEEIAVIEQNILPIMVTGGFSTVTITSVIVGGLIVGLMSSL